MALLGGVVLLGVMLMVSWSVFCRYVLNAPILGDKELVEIGMSLAVMLAMPFASLKHAHISVDILDNRIGSAGRFLGDLLARLLGCCVFYLLVGKTWEKSIDAYVYGEVTNMIEIPIWIPYGAITAGFGTCILVLLWQVYAQFRKGISGYE